MATSLYFVDTSGKRREIELPFGIVADAAQQERVRSKGRLPENPTFSAELILLPRDANQAALLEIVEDQPEACRTWVIGLGDGKGKPRFMEDGNLLLPRKRTTFSFQSALVTSSVRAYANGLLRLEVKFVRSLRPVHAVFPK